MFSAVGYLDSLILGAYAYRCKAQTLAREPASSGNVAGGARLLPQARGAANDGAAAAQVHHTMRMLWP